MRTIKFRAKTLGDNNVWVFGDLHIRSAFAHIHTDLGTKSNIDTDTIGQFTGLYDKDGKEIYEGDILLFHGEVKRVVGYEDSHMASFSLLSPYDLGFISTFGTGSFEPFYCEVIGNIHDNPEILKGGEK